MDQVHLGILCNIEASNTKHQRPSKIKHAELNEKVKCLGKVVQAMTRKNLSLGTEMLNVPMNRIDHYIIDEWQQEAQGLPEILEERKSEKIVF